MRILMQITPSHESFNTAVRDGSAREKMKRILDQQKPESAYFGEFGGRRCAILVVDLKQASDLPKYTEPWFLTFQADIELHPVMTGDDLKNAGLEDLGKNW